MVELAENDIVKFFNNSRSKFIMALKNLSSYLPINVNYSLTKAQDCDIIHNNRDFYERVPLILSAVMIVLGVIFCFLG